MTVGILNNRKISINLKFEEFPVCKWSNNLFKYVSICSLLLFYICPCSLFLSRKIVLKITTKFCILIFLLLNIFQVVIAWLPSLLVKLSGDVEVNPGITKKGKYWLSICHWNLNNMSVYVCLFKLFLLYHIIRFTNLISVSLKHILILILLFMMAIWKSLVTRLFVLITHLIPNVEVPISTTKTNYLWEL